MESSAPIETSPAVSTASPSSGSDSNQGPGQVPLASVATENNRDRTTVPSACVQCRSKHLKCDGLIPCTRCSANSFDCLYVRSRRGFKGPRKIGAQGKASSIPTNVPTSTPRACPLVRPGGIAEPLNTSPSPVYSDGVPPSDLRLHPPSVVDLPQFDIGSELMTFQTKSLPAGLDLRERCIEAFFYHFYPTHPFVVPRANFMALRKERRLDCLEAAIRYVGSFYVEQAPTIALGVEAERLAYHTDTPSDGFRVQALLVLAIGLDGYTFQEKALQMLIESQNLALELGLNKRGFASIHSNGSKIVEESWRRTWWELYVIDGMIAGVHQRSSFRLNDIPADVALPCEEKQYISGVSYPKLFDYSLTVIANSGTQYDRGFRG
jgi:hypothetical protein